MQSLSEAFEAFMFTRPQASGLFTLEFIFRVLRPELSWG